MDFENVLLLETEMNYQQNRYNISCQFLKTLLHYHVKRRSLKCCNCSASPWWQHCQLHYFFLILYTVEKHITSLTYLLPCPAVRASVTSSRCRTTVGHLARPSTEIAHLTSGEHVFAPVYGPVGTFWAVTVTVKHFQCSKFVDWSFSNWLTVHKVIIKVWHSFVIKDW